MRVDQPFESQGLHLLRELSRAGKRIFNMEDIKRFAQIQHISLHQLRKILSNLTKQGRLLRLRRGIYVGIGLLPEQTKVHPFIISAFLIQPSAISHWSALQHHGLTEQIPQVITASTPKKVISPSMRNHKLDNPNRKHAWLIEGVRYEYVTIPEATFAMGMEKIWIPWMDGDGHYQINITDKERTILDMFIHPKIFGGMGEVLGILENALRNISIEKLVAYAIKYNKKYLAKRLGWALEYFGVKEKLLHPLLNIPINHYCRLNPSEPATGSCNKRWMIQNNLTEMKTK